MYGNDHEYANSRLEQTVVVYDGKPVFVTCVQRGMTATVSYLDSIETFFKVKVDELDLHPVRLGYCNRGGAVAYLMRKPMRRDWRQGLRFGNFTAIGDFPAEALSYKDVGQVILGKYPTFAKVLEEITKKRVHSMAWCREWAIDSGLRLWHKRNVVGTIEDGKPVLNAESHFLREALEEVL
jgi:hypothetical protein